MGENGTEQKGNLNKDQCMAMENMHKTFLEALRHREQEILRFIAILAPALGGFIWLLYEVGLESEKEIFIFTVGTLGVLFLLTIGAVYSLALGYNFRYITLQLAKMESDYCLKIKDFMLKYWLRTPKEWKEKYRNGRCFPPEIIKVFWLAFVIAKILVVLTAGVFLYTKGENVTVQMHSVIIGGAICIIIAAWFAPCYYGKKLSDACEKEPDEWKKSQD